MRYSLSHYISVLCKVESTKLESFSSHLEIKIYEGYSWEIVSCFFTHKRPAFMESDVTAKSLAQVQVFR